MSTSKKDSSVETHIDDLVARLASCLQAGRDAFIEAGRIVCDIVDKCPAGALQRVAEKHQWSMAFLRSLERIGRGHLLPELWQRSGVGWRKLTAMPVDLQQLHLEQPVELLLPGGDTQMLAVDDMTPAQADQAFDVKRGVIRNLSAQRAWISDRALAQATREPTKPLESAYRIRGNSVSFAENCTLTRIELIDLLRRMER